MITPKRDVPFDVAARIIPIARSRLAFEMLAIPNK